MASNNIQPSMQSANSSHEYALVDFETSKGYRKLTMLGCPSGFHKAVQRYQKFPQIVQLIDAKTGETVKGQKYDTTTQELKPGMSIERILKVKQKPPVEDTQHEPRDRYQENMNMNQVTIFKNIVKECISEIKQELNPRSKLKESLRNVVKNVLKEMKTVPEPKATKEEKETEDKQYNKDSNVRLDKTNDKLQKELETIVHGINPDWECYWDDYNQLIVRAQNLLYVRVVQKFENNFDVDAMVKLVDRVRAIALTWEQVKAFIKANFSDLQTKANNKTIPDKKRDMAIDNYKDREVIKKDAGPRFDIIKNRGEKKNGEDAKIKSTKRDDMDYNEPQTKRDEDMPNQPMKQVTEPGKDPDGKNHNIKSTDKPKAQKHKLDKKLKIDLKKTPKFKHKQS